MQIEKGLFRGHSESVGGSESNVRRPLNVSQLTADAEYSKIWGTFWSQLSSVEQRPGIVSVTKTAEVTLAVKHQSVVRTQRLAEMKRWLCGGSGAVQEM